VVEGAFTSGEGRTLRRRGTSSRERALHPLHEAHSFVVAYSLAMRGSLSE
jgi:hypothetical protein